MSTYDENRWLNVLLPVAQSHAQAVVYHEFVTLLNPKFRGPNWKWENFETFVVRQAEVTAYQSFSDKDWNEFEALILATAKRTARIWAKTVLKDSGLMEWWPNPLNLNSEKGL